MLYKKNTFSLLLITISTFASADIRMVPGTISLLAGGDSINTIIISQQGTPSDVVLKLDGLPPGATASFSPESISSNWGISKLTINTTKETSAGNYSLIINGSGMVSTSAKLEVKNDIVFIHPGVFLSKNQMDHLENNATSGRSPWTEALTNAKNSLPGEKEYVPSPLVSVNADDSTQSNAIINDANAAYTQALLWYITKDTSYADNSIRIMNSWSEKFTGGFSGGNHINLASWTGDVWPRAAEIIRYTYLNNDNSSKWDTASIDKFKLMLTEQYIPLVSQGRPYGFYGGNLNASSAAASINIGVFNDNAEVFLRGISMWRATLPAYIYQIQDGPNPVPPVNWSAKQSSTDNLKSLWYNQIPLVNGLSQETCRDLGHVSWGLAALANGAETARLQGVDLQSETTLGTKNSLRIANGIEFNSTYINNKEITPLWLCGGKINQGSSVGTGEVFYNDLVNRRAISLPQTSTYLDNKRPTDASYFMVWETLTHDSNP